VFHSVGCAQVLLTNLTIVKGRCLDLQQIRILYAEDYDLVLFTVKQLLELEGWRVDICRDGSAALKKLESDDHYDLIILDAQMPGESGLALVHRARQLAHRRRTPIIMFTGSLRREDALAAGADAFLNKPTGLKDLITTCNSLLDKRLVSEKEVDDDLQKSVGNVHR
jgi:CheY-like chemotaxis protein